MDQIIAALEEEFRQRPDRSMDYIYGYMDALAVVRELRDGIRRIPPDVRDKIQAKE